MFDKNVKFLFVIYIFVYDEYLIVVLLKNMKYFYIQIHINNKEKNLLLNVYLINVMYMLIVVMLIDLNLN